MCVFPVFFTRVFDISPPSKLSQVCDVLRQTCASRVPALQTTAIAAVDIVTRSAWALLKETEAGSTGSTGSTGMAVQGQGGQGGGGNAPDPGELFEGVRPALGPLLSSPQISTQVFALRLVRTLIVAAARHAAVVTTYLLA